MRIGIYLGESKASVGGGYAYKETIFNALLRYNRSHRHEFVVFHWLAEDPLAQVGYKFQFVSLQRTATHKLKEYIAYLFRRLVARLRKQSRKEDFFHFWLKKLMMQHQIECIWYFSSAAPVKDIPFIITIWDLQHRRQPFWPEVSSDGKWEVLEESYREAIQRAAGVVTGTEQGKGEITYFYGKISDHIIVAPMPVPDLLPRPKNPSDNILQKYNLPERFMLYPAQFWPHKNHLGLLKAWQILQSRSEEIGLVLVGSDKGNLSYVQSSIKEYSLEGRVSILGFVTREELESLYRSASGLVYVTYFGPDNLPPLEAFSHSCPVIASLVPGASEQLGDAALLVDPSEPAEIAKAVSILIHDKNVRDQLIERGRAIARKRGGEQVVMKVINYLDRFERQRKCWPAGAQ